jgi:hypothetical protein
VQQTHELTFDATTVTKTYRSWERGEPDREWAALTVLAEHAPGLAPEPLRRHEVAGRPSITMSRLPGASLGAEPLTEAQTVAAAEAVRRVHAVPLDVLPEILTQERVAGPSTFAADIRGWLEQWSDLGACSDPVLVGEAVAAGLSWLAHPPAPRAPDVLACADGNVANYVWDGSRCRVVDLEDAGTSDHTYELADSVEHITFRLAGQADAERFARAAGLADGERERWMSYRRLFACLWLAMLVPQGPGWDRNPRGSTEDQARHLLDLLSRFSGA